MGVKLKDIVKKKEITLEELSGKIIAFDTYNILYQFLSNIRGPDGNLFTNSKGEITSHLIGLFSRTLKFLEAGIKPVFVFDGESHALKHEEQQRRRSLKEKAQEQYEDALERNNKEDMQKYSSRTSHLSPEMAAQAQTLLKLMGLPVLDAIEEGEAQAAHLTTTKEAYAVASQDYDSLLFGATRLIQNLNLAGKKKKINTHTTITIKPTIIDLEETLKEHNITHDQLIILAILVGTDFNPKGIPGLGPKKALKIIKEYSTKYEVGSKKYEEELFRAVQWSTHFQTPWQDIYNIFKNTPITTTYTLEWKEPDITGIIDFLVNEYDFQEERVKNQLATLQQKTKEVKKEKSQQTLGAFFS